MHDMPFFCCVQLGDVHADSEPADMNVSAVALAAVDIAATALDSALLSVERTVERSQQKPEVSAEPQAVYSSAMGSDSTSSRQRCLGLQCSQEVLNLICPLRAQFSNQISQVAHTYPCSVHLTLLCRANAVLAVVPNAMQRFFIALTLFSFEA